MRYDFAAIEKKWQDRWEKDGHKYSKVHIVANNVQLLGGKSEGGGVAERAAENEFGGGYKPKKQGGRQEEPEDVSPDEFPEDIPF